MYIPDMAPWSVSAPPSFVRAAGHPLRWRLMGELGFSDRRVRELASLVDQPQNLVSYHLGRLRAAGLVGSRRSSFDGRDSYYHLDLVRCGDALAAVGQALHPGLRLAPARAAASIRRCRVLFLCSGNSARSPSAEALLRQRADQIDVASAGSHPKQLHANTLRVLGEYGIDIAGRPPKHVGEFEGQHFDYVITLCDRVREVCPEFSGRAAQLHWSIADPAGSGGSDEITYEAFQHMAAELRTRIEFLLAAVCRAPVPAPLEEVS